MNLSAGLRKFKRLILCTVGIICLGLGIIGYILPGLPGTIWLIISASLFIRSSDRLYKYVIHHKLFGNQVREFLETGSIPRKVKILSIVSMWFFTLSSILFAPYGWLFDIPVLVLAIIGTLYIVSRPTKLH